MKKLMKQALVAMMALGMMAGTASAQDVAKRADGPKTGVKAKRVVVVKKGGARTVKTKNTTVKQDKKGNAVVKTRKTKKTTRAKDMQGKNVTVTKKKTTTVKSKNANNGKVKVRKKTVVKHKITKAPTKANP